MKYSIQVLKNEIECLERKVSVHFLLRHEFFAKCGDSFFSLLHEDIKCLRDCRCALAILQLEDIESKMLGIYVS